MEGDDGTEDSSLAYDPNQNREEKSKLRQSYRKLQDDDALRDPKSTDVQAIFDGLNKADKLFEHVKGPQEATLDSAFLLKASSFSALKARLMRADVGGFDVDDFVSKLVTFMGGHVQGRERDSQAPSDVDEEDELEAGPLNWDKIGRKALAKSRRVPAMEFMLGPLSVEQKKRTQVKRAKFDKDKEEERRPQEINEDDIQKSENETSLNVLKVREILESLEGEVNLFNFIVNPNSFAQSVENLFYLSFLIRDGLVTMDVKDSEPVIFACDPLAPEQMDTSQKKQMIMELDEETWKRAIEVFQIRDCMIPHRKPAVTKIGDKWYG